MGFFSRRPTFGDAVSKQQFVENWVAGILSEAEARRDSVDGVSRLTDMAADGVVRQALRATAESYGEHDVVRYLEGLELAGLIYRVDEFYRRTIDMATTGRPGPVLRERLSAFDKGVDKVFGDLRPNYVEYARINLR